MPQVNINLDDDTATQVDVMARKDGFDNRSAWVRRLIRQEIERRAQMALPLGNSTPVEQNQIAMPLEESK